MKAEDLVRTGQLEDALKDLQNQVRSNPADPKLRVFLFQLLAVLGQWERALTQLNVAAEMDPGTLLMAQVCRPALNCEAFRAEVFRGERSPLVFGEPPEWIGRLIQANQLLAQGQFSAAEELRDQAFEAAPAVSGTVDGQPFEWIADADPRLGPVLEAVLNGRYYWVPFANLRQIRIEEPQDLRDMVWAPALLTLVNGTELVGLIPARYPGSESSKDAAIRLARKTDWQEHGAGWFLGLGQRMFATDAGEYPLLETRQIVLGEPPSTTAEEPANA